MQRSTIATVFLCLWLATPAWAGFYKGFAAYYQGDHATALSEIRTLAAQGDVAAQYHLGDMYRVGKGVEKDSEEARRWYMRAAEQGYVKAQSVLGLMYDEGKDVPQDYVEAYKWYVLSATEGDDTARKNRDILAEKMTPADIFKARRLARKWRAQRTKAK